MRPRPNYAEGISTFLRLDLPSTLTRYENWAFRIWKRFVKLFKNDNITLIIIFACPRFTQTQIHDKRWWLLWLLRRSLDVKHLMSMRLQSETSVFKFLRRCVGGAQDFYSRIPYKKMCLKVLFLVFSNLTLPWTTQIFAARFIFLWACFCSVKES